MGAWKREGDDAFDVRHYRHHQRAIIATHYMTACSSLEITTIFIRVTFADGSVRQSSQKKGRTPTA